MIGSAKRTLYWLFNLLKYISCIFFVFKILYFCRTLLELYIEYNSKVKSVESPVLIQKEIQVHPLMSSILRDLLISKMKHAAIKFFFCKEDFQCGEIISDCDRWEQTFTFGMISTTWLGKKHRKREENNIQQYVLQVVVRWQHYGWYFSGSLCFCTPDI